MKKLSESEMREVLGSDFEWSEARHPVGTGPANMTVELVKLDDGRIGNILIRVTELAAVHSTEPISRRLFTIIADVLRAHGFPEPNLEHRVLEDMLSSVSGKTTTGGRAPIGFRYKLLASIGVIQLKITYEPER